MAIMNTSHNHPAYQEGKRSYFLNKGKYENPYLPGSIEHDIFERGWSQMLKRNPEITIRGTRKIQKYQSKADSEKELALQKAKEAYLKSKGD